MEESVLTDRFAVGFAAELVRDPRLISWWLTEIDPEDIVRLRVVINSLDEARQLLETVKAVAGDPNASSQIDIVTSVEAATGAVAVLGKGVGTFGDLPRLDTVEKVAGLHDSLGLAKVGGLSTGVIVFGMHRSGTSAATRLLNFAGVPLGPGDDFMAANDANPRGFFESQTLTDINDRVLAQVGGHWIAPKPVPYGWEEDPRYLGLQTLEEEANSAFREIYKTNLWGWKDPRTCVTLPFWLSAVPGIRPVMVIPYRNPLEVARSLERRDDLSKAESLALWERYTRSLLTYADGFPAFVSDYSDMLADPVAWTEQLRAFLFSLRLPLREAAAPEEIRSFIDPSLRHSAYTLEDFQSDPDVTPTQALLQQLLEELTGTHEKLDVGQLPAETDSTETILANCRERIAANEAQAAKEAAKEEDLSEEAGGTQEPRTAGLVVVDAYEALDDPDLLSALPVNWREQEVRAVLVLYAPDAVQDEIVPQLERLLETTGLNEHPAFQIEALIVPAGEELQLAERADALYSNKRQRSALRELPAFNASQVGALELMLAGR